MTVPIYIPTSSEGGLPFLHTLSSVFVYILMIGPFLIGLFIFLLLNFKSSLYILDTVLHQMCFLQIFSSSLVCLLSPLTLSFREKKFLILMKFILSIISFTDCAFGVIAKKSSPYPRTSRFSRMLPSTSFII